MTTDASPEQSAEERPIPWLQRLYDRAPVAPAWVGLGLVALLLAAYLAMELALGRFAGGSGPNDLVGMGLLTLLLCVLLAYAVTANVAVGREALAARLAAPPRGLLLAGSFFGLALSLAAPLLEIQAEPWHPYDPRG